MTTTPPRVRVGEHEIELVIPESLGQCAELVQATAYNETRGAAACLAACWRGMGRPKASLRDNRYDVLVFGQRVLDELLGRGVSLRQVLAAGQEAFGLVYDAVPKEPDVEEAEGNFEGEEGSTSPSSTSSDGSGSASEDSAA